MKKSLNMQTAFCLILALSHARRPSVKKPIVPAILLLLNIIPLACTHARIHINCASIDPKKQHRGKYANMSGQCQSLSDLPIMAAQH